MINAHCIFRCANRDTIYFAQYYLDWDSSACSLACFLFLSLIFFKLPKFTDTSMSLTSDETILVKEQHFSFQLKN